MFRDCGARLIDFDALARQVVQPGTPGLAKVVQFFGEQVLQPDGTLDRRKMAGIVFQDEAQRRALEGLIHPDIHEAFVEEIRRIAKESPGAIIVAEVPLLVEADLQHLFHRIVLVFTSEQVQIERLVSGRQVTEKAAAEMLRSQLPVEKKKKFADHIVYNDGSLEATQRQVRAVWKELQTFQRMHCRTESGSV